MPVPKCRRISYRVGIATALAAVTWGAYALGQASPRAVSDTRPLRAACRAAGVPYPPPAPRVVVRKAERRLALYSGKTRVKEYRVGLGPAPSGTKMRQGDGRTPEGHYYVCTRLEKSQFRRFLGLSYPGPQDAERGFGAGLISRTERERILTAQRRRVQPPWHTELGGAVGIHGRGSTSDWTAGCVAVDDPDIDELFAVLPLGTPVTIHP